MTSFTKFEPLNELLKSSVDFVLTNDSKPNNSFYYQFNIDGKVYAVIIAKSNEKYIYNVSAGFVPGKNLKLWKIYPAHIRQFLSTLLEIVAHVETHYLKNIAKGYAIRLPVSIRKNYVDLAVKLLKRTHFKDVNVLNVAKKEKKEAGVIDYNYIFIARKPLNVKSIFNNKAFANYDFNNFTSIPSELLDNIHDAVYVKKTNLSSQPKYGDFDLAIDELNPEDVQQKILNNRIVKKPLNDSDKLAGELTEKEKEQKQIDLYLDHGDWSYDLNTYFAAYAKTHGFSEDLDPKQFTIKFINYINENYPNKKKRLDSIFKNEGLDLSDPYLEKNELKKIYKLIKEFYIRSKKTIMLFKPDNEDGSTKVNEYFETQEKIEPFEFGKSDLPNIDTTFNKLKTKNSDDIHIEMRKYSEDSESIYDKNENVWRNDYREMNKVANNIIYSYTESTQNNFMRNIFKIHSKSFNDDMYLEDKDLSSYLQNDYYAFEFNMQMRKAINEHGTVLKENMIVFRGTHKPDLMDEFKEGFITDPGFLSTSYKYTKSQSFSNGTTLIIKLPKGTRCAVVGINGAHQHEGEIILPAFSILKIEKVLRTHYAQYILCEYIGNAMDSFLKMMTEYLSDEYKQTLKQGKLLEAKMIKNDDKKNEKSNLNDPDAFNVDMAKIKKMIDNNELIIKGIPKKKDEK